MAAPSKNQTKRDAPKGRRAYEAPAVVFREPLEAIASVCTPPGKANLGACTTGPVNS